MKIVDLLGGDYPGAHIQERTKVPPCDRRICKPSLTGALWRHLYKKLNSEGTGRKEANQILPNVTSQLCGYGSFNSAVLGQWLLMFLPKDSIPVNFSPLKKLCLLMRTRSHEQH